MKQKITPEEELQNRLNQTSTPDPAEGWEAMKFLLDRRNASQRKKPLFLQKKRVAAAAVILVLTGLSTWFFIFKNNSRSENQSTLPIAVQPFRQINAVPNHPQIHLSEIQKNSKKSTVANRPNSFEINEENIPAEKQVPALSDSRTTHFPLKYIKADLQIVIAKPTPQVPSVSPGKIRQLSTFDSRKKYAPLLKGLVTNNAVKNAAPVVPHKLHISIHLNANEASSFGHPQENFNPVLKGTPVDVYPSISINKKISKNWGLRAGLALASPVDVSPNHFNRSISDPQRTGVSPMTSDSRDEFQISRLYYVDLPVTFQYQLGNRLTVGSGLQLSVLEKVIGKKQRVDYTAYNTILYRAPDEPRPQNLMQNNYAKAGIRPLDLRWLSALYYRLSNHWAASVQFQYGLTDISDNATFLHHHKDRNVVVSAGIGFLIK